MTRCLETRTTGAVVRRRYEAPDGRRYTTYEVPRAVFKLMGSTRLAGALARHERSEAREQRKHEVMIKLSEGWKPIAVASHVGLSESMVRRYRQQRSAP